MMAGIAGLGNSGRQTLDDTRENQRSKCKEQNYKLKFKNGFLPVRLRSGQALGRNDNLLIDFSASSK